MGLKTTTVGWFPKPAAVRRARRRLAEGEIEPAELGRAELEATTEVVRLQDEVGLDVLVDGQMDRADMVASFVERLDGAEPGGLVRCFDNRYYRRPRIVGELGRTAPITVAHWQAARKMTARPLKALLPGPYTLMDWSLDEHYPSRERCCLALAELVRAEAEALVDAGASEIELDEPAISARPEELALAARALGEVTAGLRGRARTWAYVGYGDLVPVAPRLFELPVDGLLLALVGSELELVEALAGLPADKLLGAGVLDVLSAEVETDAVLRSRVERLLERVGAERLWLIPDGGLRTLEPEVVRRKLEAMVAVARTAG
jgi:5-methyltetrahydropteroyltriglutamate--homocysteine methyltransferase